MKKILTLIVVLLFAQSIEAQMPKWDWAKTPNAGNEGSSNGICRDANGNIYTTGNYNGTSITFDSITLNSIYSTGGSYLTKYDSAGNIIWARNIDGTTVISVKGICLDKNNNIYLTGSFRGYAYFESITITNFSGYDGIFIAKYDDAGNAIWAKKYSGTKDDQGLAIATDSSNNVFFTGSFRSPSVAFDAITLTNSGTVNEAYLVKTDDLGNVIWAKSATGGSDGVDQANAVTVDRNGNIYITGLFSSSTINFGSTTLTNTSTYASASYQYEESFIVKYDAAGNDIWAKSASNTYPDWGVGVITDSQDNVYIIGGFSSGNISFGGIVLTNPAPPVDFTKFDGYLVKYNSAGLVQWANRIGGINGDQANIIAKDNLDNIYVGGYFASSNFTVGTYTISNGNYGWEDFYCIKYDTTGTVKWAISDGASYTDHVKGIVVDDSAGIYLTGFYEGPPMVFGNTTINDSIPGGYRIFIAKLQEETTSLVWPGDANSDQAVNNFDILPIGIHYSETGSSRMVMGNLWQGDTATDWLAFQPNGNNLKHIDCNGDGVIDMNDTMAISSNFNSVHALVPLSNDLRVMPPPFYFTSASTSYNAGDWIDVDVWMGDSGFPANNIYGVAFNVGYNSSFIQPGTESISYPSSWLATIGTNAFGWNRTQTSTSEMLSALTRINHLNASGYGKIAKIRFQARTSISSVSNLVLKINAFEAVNNLGEAQEFSTSAITITIHPVATQIFQEINTNNIRLFPNPYTDYTELSYTLTKNTQVQIEFYNSTGLKIETIENKVQPAGEYKYKISAIEKDLPSGIYFIKIIIDGIPKTKRIVEMK